MAILKPFKGIRPLKEKVAKIASPPYDVINREEASQAAEGNPLSFLRVIKPEINFHETVNEYDPQVYRSGSTYFQRFVDDGVFVKDDSNNLYIYAQTMDGRTQYGIVGRAAVSDYINEVIRKHELTRPDKEEDRKKHIRVSKLNYEPVFFAYPANDEIDSIVAEVIKSEPEYDFTTDDNIQHIFWVISDAQIIERIVEIFDSIPYTYIADGHHRTAAAALVGDECRRSNVNHTGQEDYNYFLAVHFPDNQLKIFDYNRLVKDLNGLSLKDFVTALSASFTIECKGTQEYRPDAPHKFGMYIDNKWYCLTAKEGTYNDNDPIACLDVTILSEHVLTPILGIVDLRKSKRIDFVGGMRGLGELKKRVDTGEMAVAFALFPVSMKQLIDIADTGNIMPPKTTWFEPKLRSGLVVNCIT
jgi:uncharacterized protein (DUF1015 family)